MENHDNPKLIRFYGGGEPEMFEIERRCMDRDGHVISFLNSALPTGFILDVGAGNGFTAKRLSNLSREIIAMEPDQAMIATSLQLNWVQGFAQELPLRNSSLDSAYATWAYFLADLPKEAGLRELHRVVKRGGVIIIVDNAGDDEATSFAKEPYPQVADWYVKRGFEKNIINTSFRFDTVEEAQRLMTFYFGNEQVNHFDKIEYEFRVAAYVGNSKGA